jgi:putative transposase
MGRNIYRPEQIIAKLRQIEVLLSQGQNVANIFRQPGITEQTYLR